MKKIFNLILLFFKKFFKRKKKIEVIKKKYLIFGGYIHSKNDGDLHFISGDRLRQLYNINKEDCIIVNNEEDKMKIKGIKRYEFIELYPKFDGKYENLGGKRKWN